MSRKMLLQALEPRVLLDAAGLVTAAETAQPTGGFEAGTENTNSQDHTPAAFAAIADTTVPAISDSQDSKRKTLEDADTPISIDGITVSDANKEDVLTLTISVADNNAQANPGAIEQLLQFGSTSGLTVVAAENGVYTLSGSADAINLALDGLSAQPAEHYNGTITLTFAVTDAAGNVGDAHTVDIEVTAVNDQPTLSDSIQIPVSEGGSLTFSDDAFGLLDPDITTGNQVEEQMIIRIDRLPSNGTLTLNGNLVVAGTTFSYDQLDQLVYTHDGSDVAVGDTDAFTVTVNDGAGESSSANVTLNLQPVNQPPAVNHPGGSIFEGQSTHLGLTLVDRESQHADVPGDTLVTITDISDGLTAEGRLFLDNDGDGKFGAGDVELGLNSTFSADQLNRVAFEHNGNETGLSGALAFSVSLTDSGGGEGAAGSLTGSSTVNLDITPVNDDPVLDINNGATVNPGGYVVITKDDLLVTDVDSIDKHLVYTLEQMPEHGLLQAYIDGAWQTLDVGARFTQEQINNKQILFLLPSSAADGATADGFVFSVRDSSLSPWPAAGQEGAIRDDAGVIATDLRFSITINRDDDGSDGGVDPGDEDGVIPPPPPPVDGGGSGGDGGGNGGDGGGNGGDNGGNEGGDNGGDNNEPLQEGGTVSIGSDVLQTNPSSGDGDRVIPPDEIVYTVTSLPPNGELQQLVDGNWEPIKFYGQFTQADIDAGNIRFEHDGGEDHDSSFSYSVSVGGENRVEGTVSLSAKPVNDITGATGGSLVVVEKTDSTDGIVAITPEQIGMRDPDGSLDDVAGDDGEGNKDTLWFQITDLPDNGSLQYWDGDSWEAVQSDQWFSQEILLTPADGNDSGLRYVHEGGDQPSDLSDGFSFKVRDDLAAPGSPFDVQTNLSEPAADNVSNTAVVAIAIAAFNDAPLVPGASGDASIQGKDQSGNDVTAVNNGLTADNGNAVNEGGMAVISGDDLRAIDSDNNAIQRQYLITDNVDNGTLYLNGKALGVGSTFTQADIDSGRLTYQHDGSENHSDSFSFIVSDGVSETPLSSFAIEITPANDTAEIQAPDRVDGSDNSTIDLGNGTITVVDSDLAEISVGEEDQLTVILELTEKGSDTLYDEGYLALGAGFSSLIVGGSDQSSTITLRGTQADIQVALDSLKLVLEDTGDSADKDTVLELKVSVDDRLYDAKGDLADPQSANGGAFNESGEAINQDNNVVNKTIEILLSTTNDDPILTVPGDITVSEDLVHDFSGTITITDADAFDKTIRVTLDVQNGTLTLPDDDLIVEGANGSSSITLEGSQQAINEALAALEYRGNTDYHGSDTLKVTVNDLGNSGTGGSADIIEQVAITVTPVNDAPILNVPGTQVLDEGVTVKFSQGNGNQITIAEPSDSPYTDTFTDIVEVTLSVDDSGTGASLILGSISGITFKDNTANGALRMVIKGTIADINRALEGLTYTASSSGEQNQTVNLDISVNDLNNGQNNSLDPVTGSIEIQVSNVNNRPEISAPDRVEVNEDGSLVFGSDPKPTISISDVDAFDRDIVVTITATHGQLSLAGNDGASVNTSDNAGIYTLTLTGTQAEINQALDGLKFTPDANFHGDAVITVSVDDQGNTGVGDGTDTHTIDVTINPVNDQPGAGGTVWAPSVAEDNGNPAGTKLSDLVDKKYNDNTDDQQGSGGNDTSTELSFIAIIGNKSKADQGTWQVSDGGGGWIDIPLALGKNKAFIVSADSMIRFVPAADFHGTPGQLNVLLADSHPENLSKIEASQNAGDLKKVNNSDETSSWSKVFTKIKTKVTNVNDNPDATGDALLPSVDEDADNPTGNTVGNLFTPVYSDAVDDQRSVKGGKDERSSLGGIAITANPSNASEGTWQYNTGNGWQDVPAELDTNALLLSNDAQLRFVPADNFNGEASGLTVRLSDTPVTNGTGDISGSLGDTGQWSDTTTLKTTVEAVNDTPILTTGGTVDYTEGDAYGTPVKLAPGGSITDIELKANREDNFDSATLTVQRKGEPNDLDKFGFDFTDTNLSLQDKLIIDGNKNTIATITSNAGSLSLTFSEHADEASADTVIQSITYSNNDNAPAAGEQSTVINIEFAFNDGNDPTTLPQGTGIGATTALVTVRVTGTNDKPAANNDAGSTNEESDLTVSAIDGVLINDTDPDTNDSLEVDGISGKDAEGKPVDVAPGESVKGSNGGSFVINKDGSYTFEPGDDFQSLAKGEQTTTSVTYSIDDGNGGTDTATLTITVTGVNDAPEAVNDSKTTNEDTPINSNATDGVLKNDTDPDGSDTLSVTQVSGEDGDGNATTVAAGSSVKGNNGGTFTLNADGSYRFEPGQDFQYLAVGESTTTTVTYEISDGNGGTDTATLTITVTGTNDGPDAVNDTNTTNEETKINIGADQGVLVNDSDTDTSDTLVVSAVAGNNGALGNAVQGDNGGTFIINADGSYSFDPGSDFQHLAVNEFLDTTITYTVSDGEGGTDTATLTIRVTGANDVPTAVNDLNTTTEDAPLNVAADNGVLVNDSDTDTSDAITVSGVSGKDSSGAPLTVTPGTAVQGDNGGTFIINADGSYSFDPGQDFQQLAAGEWLKTTVTYEISDGNGGTTTATLEITVTGLNDGPDAVNDAGSTDEETTLSVDKNDGVLKNDSDTDTSDTLVVNGVAGQDGLLGQPVKGSNGGTFIINADGSYSFNPGQDFQHLAVNETTTTAVTYRISDGKGGTDTATLTITVRGVNDAPEAQNNSGVVTEDTATQSQGNVITDNDGSGIDKDIDGDDLTIERFGQDGNSVNAGTTIDGKYGQLTLDANGNYTYTLDNDSDVIQALSVNETLTETFTYTISDGNGGTATAELTITIRGTNDDILAADNTGSVSEDQTTTDSGNVITEDDGFGTDRDLDGDELFIAGVNGDNSAVGSVVQGEYGRLIINSDGSYRYELDNSSAAVQRLTTNQTVTDVFTYTVTDRNGSASVAELVITIEGLDEPFVPLDPDPAPPEERPGFDIPGRPDGEIPSINPGRESTLLDFLDSRINPVRLTVQLQDQVVTEGVYNFSLPGNAFEHSDPAQLIRMEAMLSDGSQLPDYIRFDNQNGAFMVDADAAIALGIESVDIRVVGRDLIGNEAGASFNITFAGTVIAANDVVDQLNQLEAPAAGEVQPEATSEEREGEAAADHATEKGDDLSLNAPASLEEQLERAGAQGFLQSRDKLITDLIKLGA